jgi:hypothetical protein
MRKIKNERLQDFRLIPNSSGIILNGIYVKKDNSEIIIRSAFGGEWHFRPLGEEEEGL